MPDFDPEKFVRSLARVRPHQVRLERSLYGHNWLLIEPTLPKPVENALWRAATQLVERGWRCDSTEWVRVCEECGAAFYYGREGQTNEGLLEGGVARCGHCVVHALKQPEALQPWLNNPHRALPVEAEAALEELGFEEAGYEVFHTLQPKPEQLPQAKLVPGYEQVFTLRWVRGFTMSYAVWRRAA